MQNNWKLYTIHQSKGQLWCISLTFKTDAPVLIVSDSHQRRQSHNSRFLASDRNPVVLFQLNPFPGGCYLSVGDVLKKQSSPVQEAITERGLAHKKQQSWTGEQAVSRRSFNARRQVIRTACLRAERGNRGRKLLFYGRSRFVLNWLSDFIHEVSPKVLWEKWIY